MVFIGENTLVSVKNSPFNSVFKVFADISRTCSAVYNRGVNFKKNAVFFIIPNRPV